MDTMRIDILNPKAKKLLKDLADMDLIIQDTTKNSFAGILKKLRSKNIAAPTLAEITHEVELVRSKRYLNTNLLSSNSKKGSRFMPTLNNNQVL